MRFAVIGTAEGVAAVASFPAIPEAGPNRLVIVVKTARLMPAGEAGKLLAAFDRAFRSWAWARYRRRGIGLDIADTGSGSWWVVLTAAKDTYELLSAEPGLLGIFVADINTSMKALAGTSPQDVPKYLRDLLRSLGETGKRALAETIDLVSIIRVTLDPAAFDLITRPDVSGAKPKGRRTKSVELPELRLPAGLAERLEQHMSAGDLRARLYHIDEVWYARPKNMHGVMLPIHLPIYSVETPVDRGDFIITGTLERSDEGHPIAIRAISLQRDRTAGWRRSLEEDAAELLRRGDTGSPPRLPPPAKR